MTKVSVRRPRWHFGVPVAINFTSVLLSFVARMVLARIAGPAAFGTFAVWQNNVQLFGTLGTLGQPNYVIRETTQADHPRSGLARDVAVGALVLTVAGAGLFGMAGALIFRLLQDGDFTGSMLQWGATVMFGLLLTLSGVHRGLGSLIVGIVFDRLVSQILFLAFLVIAAGAIAGGALGAMAAFTVTLSIAAIASVAYLLNVVGMQVVVAATRDNIARHWRGVLPFFLVNSLFVVNARYLLTYSGMVVSGDVLGQVGLVFTVVALMVIPTSTLNLIAAPYLAKRIQSVEARRVTVLYLSFVAAIVVTGVAVVALAYPIIFRLAAMAQTIAPQSILLLSAAFGLTLLGNAAVIVLQFAGRAGEAAKLFSVATAAKLTAGYFAGQQLGLIALFWVDVAVGLVFVAAALFKVLAPRSPTAGAA